LTLPAPGRWTLRYAPHLGLRAPDAPLFLHSAGSADPVAQVEHAHALGFAGVQDNFLKIRTPDMQAAIGAALQRTGLEMGSFVNSVADWNAPLWGSPEPEALARVSADLETSVAAAARVGGRCVTVTSGRHPGVPLRYQQTEMVEKLRRLAERAGRGGLVLVVEATSERFLPGMLVPSIADAHAIVRAVDHPAVRVSFDVAHVHAMDGEILPNLAACRGTIGLVQVADNPGRTDLGSGEINWATVLRAIRAQGYDGMIELEHLPAAPGREGEQALLERLAAIDAAL
jgi:hydroxypyruvate isomerase